MTMTHWLMVLPRQSLPPGIGTLAADIEGLYIERLTEDNSGWRWSWQEVVDRLLADPSPADPEPATGTPLPSNFEARLADLERRVTNLTAVLGSLALSATVDSQGQRLNRLETLLERTPAP